MKITITVIKEHNEQAAHLRQGLICLLNRLGFVPVVPLGGGYNEWVTMEAEGPAPLECNVHVALPFKFDPITISK